MPPLLTLRRPAQGSNSRRPAERFPTIAGPLVTLLAARPAAQSLPRRSTKLRGGNYLPNLNVLKRYAAVRIPGSGTNHVARLAG
jgi:hypothetical protein